MRSLFFINSLIINNACNILYRQFSLNTANGKSYIGREAKMLGKLLSPTKRKRKLIFDDISTPSNKGPKFNHFSGGKETSRRIAVLNSLFIKHISDLMVNGNFACNAMDKGLELTRVSIAPSFRDLNVFWSANTEENMSALEEILPKIGFELRHELSQLGVMGVVPRIIFVRDKHIASALKVDYLLSIADFGEDHIPLPLGSEFKEPSLPQNEVVKVNTSNSDSEEENSVSVDEEETMPVMRQDIFNLDHKAILGRIMKSMTKSRALHRFQPNLAVDCQGTALPSSLEANQEFVSKTDRKEALNRFILSRRILAQKKLQNKYKSNLHPSNFEESTDNNEFEYDDFEAEDYIDKDDIAEDHKYNKN